MPDQRQPPDISSPFGTPPSRVYRRRVLYVIGLVCVIGLVVVLVWHLLWLLGLIFAAILFAIFLQTGAEWLALGIEKVTGHRMGSGGSLALFCLVLVGLVVGFGAVAVPPLAREASALAEKLPEALGELEEWLDEQGLGNLLPAGMAERLRGGGQPQQPQMMMSVPGTALPGAGLVVPPDPGAVTPMPAEPQDAGAAPPGPENQPDELPPSEPGVSEPRAPPGQSESPQPPPDPLAPRSQDEQQDQPGEPEGDGAPDPEDEPAEDLRPEEPAEGATLLEEGGAALAGAMGDGGGGVMGFLWAAVGGVATFTIAVLFIMFSGLYMAAEPGLYRRGLLWVIPPRKRREADETLGAVGTVLRYWLYGQLVEMVFIGVTAGVGLWILGVPLPAINGTIAGVLTFIPNFGPVASAIPPMLLAFTTEGNFFDGPTTALAVAGWYTLIQAAESYLITPMVQRKAVEMPPALLIATQLGLAMTMGIIGITFAAPATAAAMVLVRRLWVVGDTKREHPKDRAHEGDDPPPEQAHPPPDG